LLYRVRRTAKSVASPPEKSPGDPGNPVGFGWGACALHICKKYWYPVPVPILKIYELLPRNPCSLLRGRPRHHGVALSEHLQPTVTHLRPQRLNPRAIRVPLLDLSLYPFLHFIHLRCRCLKHGRGNTPTPCGRLARRHSHAHRALGVRARRQGRRHIVWFCRRRRGRVLCLRAPMLGRKANDIYSRWADNLGNWAWRRCALHSGCHGRRSRSRLRC
jgi:hypothetical protein